jgi:Gram-negative bacterial TonB protein C-terminal
VTQMAKSRSGEWISHLLRTAGTLIFVLFTTFDLGATNLETSRSGVCEREGEAIVGVKPIRPGKTVRAPKKIRNVNPRYPELPHGTRGSGMWAGEVLLDTKGNVSRVWAIREVHLTPLFPSFNEATVDAIRQWQFEPLVVNAKPMPVCMTVTVNINWR